MTICILTDTATKQIETLCKDLDVFAISLNLKGGGCAGFEYDWNTIKTEEDLLSDDETMQAGTGHFVIGGTSIMFLIGTKISYVTSLVGSNFEITNPNAQSACGCGISVNFDI